MSFPEPIEPTAPAAAPEPAPKKKESWLKSRPLIGAVGLLLGIGLGAGVGRGPAVTSAAPAAALPTPSASATPTQEVTTPEEEPTVEPEPAMFVADPADFTVKVKVREKECFGSAGCNVIFRIDPGYIGMADLPDEGEISVTYKVKGAEDPIINTFTIDADGNAHYDSEEIASTSTSGAKLTAVVIEAEYDPMG